MLIEVLRPLAFCERNQALRKGDVIDLPDSVARHWIETGSGQVRAVPLETAVKPEKRKKESR